VELFRDTVKRIIDQSMYKSYTLTSGGQSSYYFNIDVGARSAKLCHTICDCYADRIGKLRNGDGIDKLAFIRRQDTSEPAGALTFMPMLVIRTKIPSIIINLERIGNPRIEGTCVDENTLIVTDNITSGREIANVAKAIRSKRGVVSTALVFLDREEGGKEYLKQNDIELEAIISKSELKKLGVLREPSTIENIPDKLDHLIKTLGNYNPRWRNRVVPNRGVEKELEKLLTSRLIEAGFEVERQVRLEKSGRTIDMVVNQEFGVEIKVARKTGELTTLEGQLHIYLEDLTRIVAVVFLNSFSLPKQIDNLKNRFAEQDLLDKKIFIIQK
jgi:orotate phosphoribosyltransferase